MLKQRIIAQIQSSLYDIGITPILAKDADVVLQTSLIDAKWTGGNRKIDYQASAYLEEASGTCYFWEFTKDTGSGFSFGGFGETTFQSGATVSRKVRSVAYGVDGKAYEYEFDLGAITKSFKEAVLENGWRFKVVLRRDKAQYPQR